MSLTLENAQVAQSTFDTILVVRYRNDFARYRSQVGARMDQELRSNDLEVRPRRKIERDGPDFQDEFQGVSADNFQIGGLTYFKPSFSEPQNAAAVYVRSQGIAFKKSCIVGQVPAGSVDGSQ